MKNPSRMKRIPGIAAASALLSTALMTTALAHVAGRMTGGGSIVCSNGGFRVTHGFELHCIDDDDTRPPYPTTWKSIGLILWPVSGKTSISHSLGPRFAPTLIRSRRIHLMQDLTLWWLQEQGR